MLICVGFIILFSVQLISPIGCLDLPLGASLGGDLLGVPVNVTLGQSKTNASQTEPKKARQMSYVESWLTGKDSQSNNIGKASNSIKDSSSSTTSDSSTEQLGADSNQEDAKGARGLNYGVAIKPGAYQQNQHPASTYLVKTHPVLRQHKPHQYPAAYGKSQPHIVVPNRLVVPHLGYNYAKGNQLPRVYPKPTAAHRPVLAPQYKHQQPYSGQAHARAGQSDDDKENDLSNYPIFDDLEENLYDEEHEELNDEGSSDKPLTPLEKVKEAILIGKINAKLAKLDALEGPEKNPKDEISNVKSQAALPDDAKPADDKTDTDSDDNKARSASPTTTTIKVTPKQETKKPRKQPEVEEKSTAKPPQSTTASGKGGKKDKNNETSDDDSEGAEGNSGLGQDDQSAFESNLSAPSSDDEGEINGGASLGRSNKGTSNQKAKKTKKQPVTEEKSTAKPPKSTKAGGKGGNNSKKDNNNETFDDNDEGAEGNIEPSQDDQLESDQSGLSSDVEVGIDDGSS